MDGFARRIVDPNSAGQHRLPEIGIGADIVQARRFRIRVGEDRPAAFLPDRGHALLQDIGIASGMCARRRTNSAGGVDLAGAGSRDGDRLKAAAVEAAGVGASSSDSR